ncbi:DUF3290 domain-containing protein [Enterococcus sp. LJL98]
MDFYGIGYLEAQSGINDFIKYIFIFSVLFVFVIVFSFYLRHQIQKKYRDLSLLVFLLLLFLSGVQYSEYKGSQNRHSESSQMVNFVEQVAAENQLQTSDIYVNATQLRDGVIVKIADEYYRTILSNERNTYMLERTYLLNPTIHLVE